MPEDPLVFLDHVTQHGTDYSGRKLRMFTSVGSRFENCTFNKATVLDFRFGAGMEQSEYINCSFDHARLDVGGGFARFVECSFQNADIRNWICFAVEMIDCMFSGTLRQVIFNGTVPAEKRQFVGREHNEFRGNNFSALKLMDVTFRTGIDLTKQRLPSSPDYIYLSDPAPVLARSRQALVEDLTLDPDIRQSALGMVGRMQETVNKGQKQLFIRPENYYFHASGGSRAYLELVFSFLRNDGFPIRNRPLN